MADAILSSCNGGDHSDSIDHDQAPAAVKVTLPSVPPEFIRGNDLQALRSQIKSSYERTVTNLLSKFSDLRSLHFIYDDNDDYWIHQGIRCMKKFTLGLGFDRAGRIFMEKFKEAWDRDDDPGFNRKMYVGAILWHELVVMCIQDYPMLQSVEITTPNIDSLMDYFSNEEEIKLKKLIRATGAEHKGEI